MLHGTAGIAVLNTPAGALLFLSRQWLTLSHSIKSKLINFFIPKLSSDLRMSAENAYVEKTLTSNADRDTAR